MPPPSTLSLSLNKDSLDGQLSAIFPSTLASPAFSNANNEFSFSNEDEKIHITESTFEARQQSLMNILEETSKILSSLATAIQDNDAIKGDQCLDNFSQKLAFKYPTKRSQLKILNLAPINQGKSAVFSSFPEDDPLTRKLLISKIQSSLIHIKRLKLRLVDTSIRILVTGDVNSGKSTLINALLETPSLLPMDQQPCTSTYCEVVIGESNDLIDPRFPVHAIPKLETYSPNEKSSYNAISINDMQLLSSSSLLELNAEESENVNSAYAWLRIFLQPQELNLFPLASCSLIDSPGLNHDTLQTMSLFAKQDDIDILIFVINAANHLTLSASEFLQESVREKEKIFIVVNKFDEIRDKQKCKRVVLQQIANLLPSTFSDADRLIHFVSAKETLLSSSNTIGKGVDNEAKGYNGFTKFQESLSSWATAPELRAKTKLGPPSTLLNALLNDLLELSLHNSNFLEIERRKLISIASREIPLEEKILNAGSFFLNSLLLDSEGEKSAREALAASLEQLGALVDGGGLLVSARLVQNLEIRWPGALALFSLPSWIRAFAETLKSIAIAQLAICKSIAVGCGAEGASRIKAKSIEILPELFEVCNENEPSTNTELIVSSKQNTFDLSAIKEHQPDLSAFNVSGWAILLDIRSEVYQLVSYLSAIGALTGLAGLALRVGLSSAIGSIAQTYFRQPEFSPYGKSVFGGPSIIFSSIAIMTVGGIGMLTFLLKDAKIAETSHTSPMPGRFETHLREKIANFIIKRLQETSWKEYESAAIASIAKDSTRTVILGIQTRYQIRLSAVNRRQAEREAYISLLEDRFAYFKSLQRKCNILLNELELQSQLVRPDY